MTVVRVRKSQAPHVQLLDDHGKPEPPMPWSPEALYRLSSAERRVLFLELVAFAIDKSEGFETRPEAKQFFARLRRNREKRWGSHPWPRAKEDVTYLEYVEELATVFANAGSADAAEYPGRRRG